METLFCWHLNMPSEIGKTYLFFLRKPEDYEGRENLYTMCGLELGRYPLLASGRDSVESMTFEECYLYMEDENYRNIYAEVFPKYMQ